MATEAAVSFWPLLGYTAIGAAVCWGKYGKEKLRIYFLSKILDEFVDANSRWRTPVEIVTFILLGCAVGMGVVNPSTPIQALTAGFGWTGLLSKK